ncbi:MAG TPA: pectinesterase family protein, partial [Tepidisphaeraceae bacterium]|nr:pectinesterase family protein [Tepidisphaeraceae bacterium]
EGSEPAAVVITYDLHAKSILPPSTQPVGTTGSTSTLINADDFTAENVTFENPSGHIAQAVAVKTNGDRIVFRNCRFLGGQDTLYPNGHRTYFKDCYIEGRVDFIFGKAVAVFENCHIHSKNGGYVTAASTPQEQAFGFIFLNCRLTGDGEQAFLGRPWKPYAAVAFIQCELGDHIRPEGWDNWRNPENEKTARFVEYKNTGPGADRSRRVAWSRELTDDEAAAYTVANILGGADGWDPTR